MALAVVAVPVGACTRDVTVAPPVLLGAFGRLVAGNDCEALSGMVRDLVTTAATTTVRAPALDARAATESAADSAPAAGAPAAGPPGVGSASAGTVEVGENSQVAGVAEGDLVVTDGQRLVSVPDGVLRVARLGDPATVTGTLDLTDRLDAGPAQLFLRGDEVLVVATTSLQPPPVPGDDAVGSDAVAWAWRPAVALVRVALPADGPPTVIESTRVEGALVASRSTGGATRVVLRSTPAAALGDLPARPGAGIGVDGAAAVLPVRLDPDGAARPVGRCEDVLVDASALAPSDPDTTVGAPAPEPGPWAGGGGAVPERLTVLSVRGDLADLAPTSVLGAAENVYATADRLYATATGWSGDTGTPVTAVHRFELGGDGPARHSASGLVPGEVLDQYALSERGEDLRIVTTATASVASTTTWAPPTDEGPGAPAIAVAPWAPTAGRLAVLRPDGQGALVEVGRLEDLGVGETVRSVRFVDGADPSGDLAYVVTFRRTDPLFAVSLADPTAPRLLGELKIPGFSEYLHPVGGGRLLGIGREVDAATGADLGMKVSLFDVSDPTAPAEADTLVLPDAMARVGDEPLAFGWDPARSQAVVPVVRSDARGSGPALVIGVDGDGLALRGELAHDPGATASGQVLRSRVVDGTIWTVSDAGLGRTPADAPATVDLLRW